MEPTRIHVLHPFFFIALYFLMHLPATQAGSKIIFEDFSDMVTKNDVGFNDFSGSQGVLNDNIGKSAVIYHAPDNACLRLKWNFANQTAYTGYFFSLFGAIEETVTYNASYTEKEIFNKHFLDFTNIDAPLNAPLGQISIESVCFLFKYRGENDLNLRFEIKDIRDKMTAEHDVSLSASDSLQCIRWQFEDINKLNASKKLSFILESSSNANADSLDLHEIYFLTQEDLPDLNSDAARAEQTLFKACQYFIDWSSRKTESQNFPQDRSTFAALLTTGGVGFALPAFIVAAEKGWLTRQEAAERCLSIIRILADSSAFGPETMGRLGYKGWFYHFLGLDGKRKLNRDYPETTQIDESKNTVELSSIDTGLALMGLLTAQSYFHDHAEISDLVQTIYNRVNWPFMLDAESKQLYLGWKPERNDHPGHPFTIERKDCPGFFSGYINKANTLDFYTDELLILTVLGLGSETFPLPLSAYLTMGNDMHDRPVLTWPGASFTYQFLPGFLPPQCLTWIWKENNRINWYDNARQAMTLMMQHAATNPGGFAAYGLNAFGLSAAEGPYDAYHAYGAQPIALGQAEEDGTVTYYGMLSTAGLGASFNQRVRDVLKDAWISGRWHPRFGLPDAWNADISQAALDTAEAAAALRTNGGWVQRTNFAIDQGPMLLHLCNAFEDSLIWRLTQSNPNIQRGLEKLEAITSISNLPSTQPPADFILQRNYPNPFNSTTRIPFVLSRKSPVVFKIYNTQGQCVFSEKKETLPAGRHQINWHAAEQSSGLYYYQLITGFGQASGKCLYLK